MVTKKHGAGGQEVNHGRLITAAAEPAMGACHCDGGGTTVMAK